MRKYEFITRLLSTLSNVNRKIRLNAEFDLIGLNAEMNLD